MSEWWLNAHIGRPISELHQKVLDMDAEIGTIREQFADLVTLAEKVAALNPDAGEIGAGMLQQLVSLARKALGEEERKPVPVDGWTEDDDHWTSPDGRKWEYSDRIQGGCDHCAFGYGVEQKIHASGVFCGKPQCEESTGVSGKTWQPWNPA